MGELTSVLAPIAFVNETMLRLGRAVLHVVDDPPTAIRRAGFVTIDMLVRVLPRVPGQLLNLFLLLSLTVLVVAVRGAGPRPRTLAGVSPSRSCTCQPRRALTNGTGSRAAG